MLRLTFPAKHFSGKYVTTKHFDLFFHMFQRLSVYPLFCLKHKYERLKDDRHKVVECHCSTAPHPLILHWVNPGENWPTVGPWGWQKSADLPLLPPSPALHTSWRATTSASKKHSRSAAVPATATAAAASECQCKWFPLFGTRDPATGLKTGEAVIFRAKMPNDATASLPILQS